MNYRPIILLLRDLCTRCIVPGERRGHSPEPEARGRYRAKYRPELLHLQPHAPRSPLAPLSGIFRVRPSLQDN